MNHKEFERKIIKIFKKYEQGKNKKEKELSIIELIRFIRQKKGEMESQKKFKKELLKSLEVEYNPSTRRFYVKVDGECYQKIHHFIQNINLDKRIDSITDKSTISADSRNVK